MRKSPGATRSLTLLLVLVVGVSAACNDDPCRQSDAQDSADACIVLALRDSVVVEGGDRTLTVVDASVTSRRLTFTASAGGGLDSVVMDPGDSVVVEGADSSYTVTRASDGTRTILFVRARE